MRQYKPGLQSRSEPRFFFAGAEADLKIDQEPEPIFCVGSGSFFGQVKNELMYSKDVRFSLNTVPVPVLLGGDLTARPETQR